MGGATANIRSGLARAYLAKQQDNDLTRMVT
jgi:hypothetical protein